ncbi:MAG TPA: hypothetical protein VM658_20250 [bacterium]|nr:hypothetical protein [bacterium]
MVKKLKVKRNKNLAQTIPIPEEPPLMIKATIPFAKLTDSMEREELVLFLYAGMMLNEINMLSKWMGFCRKQFNDELEKRAQEAQYIFCLGILIGKLNECWDFLKRNYFGNKLSEKYDGKLDDEAKEAKEKLNQYFGRKNIIHKIRNELAFHYSNDNVITMNSIIDDMIQKPSPDKTFDIYLSRAQGFSLFYSNHELMTSCLIKIVDDPDFQEAGRKLSDEVMDIANKLIVFLNYLLFVLINNPQQWNTQEIESPRGIKPEQAFLPFFFDAAPE